MGDGLSPSQNLVVDQHEGAGPSRVHPTAHEADLVGAGLQGQDSASDEGAHHIFAPEAFFREVFDSLHGSLDLRVAVIWNIAPILLGGRTGYEGW